MKKGKRKERKSAKVRIEGKKEEMMKELEKWKWMESEEKLKNLMKNYRSRRKKRQ